MIPEGTEAANVTPEQIAQVAADVETARRAWKLTVKEIARAIVFLLSPEQAYVTGAEILVSGGR